MLPWWCGWQVLRPILYRLSLLRVVLSLLSLCQITNQSLSSMAAAVATQQTPPAPQVVEYDPITGVPAEFNEFLPKDCDEYKKWKASQESGVEGQVADLKVSEAPGQQIEKKLPGGKVKKKSKPEVVLERNTRNKKKCVTTISGLDTFGIKLADASKLFGKKFASGAAITKSPTEKDQIDVQGDFLDKAADFILKTYSKDKGIQKSDIYIIDNKKKMPAYGEEEEA